LSFASARRPGPGTLWRDIVLPGRLLARLEGKVHHEGFQSAVGRVSVEGFDQLLLEHLRVRLTFPHLRQNDLCHSEPHTFASGLINGLTINEDLDALLQDGAHHEQHFGIVRAAVAHNVDRLRRLAKAGDGTAGCIVPSAKEERKLNRLVSYETNFLGALSMRGEKIQTMPKDNREKD
jgi:hypothetical protein